MMRATNPTQDEVFFGENQLIVSKTDTKGRLTYVNNVFCTVSSFSEGELIGKPHAIIRHPDMPRAVFKLLWDTILEGREIFAYVKNLTKTGGYYWVFAHVTPSRNERHEIIGFHSSRRVPKRSALEEVIIPLYRELTAIEGACRNAKDGLRASAECLHRRIAAQGKGYDEFVFSL